MAAIMSTVFYRDPMAALRWLGAAFGFDTALLVADKTGKVSHAEMAWRDGAVGVGGELTNPEMLGATRMVSPLALDGAASQFIHVELKLGIDAHCARARAAGGVIVQEPGDQVYGARTYRALDPEGHVSNFKQISAEAQPPDVEAARGLKVRTSLNEKET